MIEAPTVFILGAGIHCSYGFPSGERLKTDIVGAVQASITNPVSEMTFSHLASCGAAEAKEVQPTACRSFVQGLSGAGQLSVDAFLNANKDQTGFRAIGKGAIAQVLLDYRTVTPYAQPLIE